MSGEETTEPVAPAILDKAGVEAALDELKKIDDSNQADRTELENRRTALWQTISEPLRLEFAKQEAKYLEDIGSRAKEADKLQQAIRVSVVAGGKTVKGNGYIAVWNKGRTTWNVKLLPTLKELLTQVLAFLEKLQVTDEPTCTIKKS